MILNIESKEYKLEFDPRDPFVKLGFKVAYSEKLAQDFMPVFLDPDGFGSKPFPPDFLAYRLIVDLKGKKLCALYEVYWRRQDCTWRELNKDHDHDYEQIQVHFNLQTGEKEKIVISSVGPVENAGHGVEVYSQIPKAVARTVEYITSTKKFFPWGGKFGEKNTTQIREIPIKKLFFEKGKPVILVLNCYHAFVGLKRQLSTKKPKELKIRLERLDQKLLDKWYYRHSENRFGHDISKPFEEPHIMYFPPPGDWLSRFAYGFLWVIYSIKRIFS